MSKLNKKIVDQKTAALGDKHMGNSTDGQPDGFMGVGPRDMEPKPRNIAGEQTVFGTDSKPSGFRGKSLPGEPSCNLDKAQAGNNVGGGKL